MKKKLQEALENDWCGWCHTSMNEHTGYELKGCLWAWLFPKEKTKEERFVCSWL